MFLLSFTIKISNSNLSYCLLLVIVGGGALDAPKKQLQNPTKTGRPGAVPYKVCLGHLYDQSQFISIVISKGIWYNGLPYI